MDQKDLGIERYDAGRDFLAALRSLGLNPEGLFWAYDEVVSEFVLVMITAAFDYAGPLELSRKLFAAYNAAATPKQISPFILRLHSPAQRIYRELSPVQSWTGHEGVSKEDYDRQVLSGEREAFAVSHFEYGGLVGFGAWIYVHTSVVIKPTIEAGRSWNRFRRNVEALQAA